MGPQSLSCQVLGTGVACEFSGYLTEHPVEPNPPFYLSLSADLEGGSVLLKEAQRGEVIS